MDWSQFRISFLIAFLPGLLVVIFTKQPDWIDRILAISMSIVWLTILTIHIGKIQ